MLKFEIVKGTENYKDPGMVGDRLMIELLDYYIEKRKDILAKDFCKKNLVVLMESVLLKDDKKSWWTDYSKKYINSVLWLFRRFRKGLSKNEEFEFIFAFYMRLNYWDQHAGVGKQMFENQDFLDYFKKEMKDFKKKRKGAFERAMENLMNSY